MNISKAVLFVTRAIVCTSVFSCAATTADTSDDGLESATHEITEATNVAYDCVNKENPGYESYSLTFIGKSDGVLFGLFGASDAKVTWKSEGTFHNWEMEFQFNRLTKSNASGANVAHGVYTYYTPGFPVGNGLVIDSAIIDHDAETGEVVRTLREGTLFTTTVSSDDRYTCTRTRR